MTVAQEAPAFFSPEWAVAVRDAVEIGPDDGLKEAKLPGYWEWIDNARNGYNSSWAIADTDLGATLLLEWVDGHCVRGEIVGDDEAGAATYLLTAKHAVWEQLLDGADAGRQLMCRDIELRRGNVLQFYRGVYFVVESLATIGRVPAMIG